MKKILAVILILASTSSLAREHAKKSDADYFHNIDLSGYLEIIAEYVDNFNTPATSDIFLSEASLTASTNLNNKIYAEMEFFHADRYADLRLDEAFLKYKASPSVEITAGRYEIPFGKYDASLVYSSYVKAIGQSRQDSMTVAVNKGFFTASAFAFNGEGQAEEKPDRIDSFGGELNFEGENWLVAIGYINNINDSRRLVARITTNNEYVDASILSLRYKFSNGFKIFGEYITSHSKFNPTDLQYKNRGAQISAYHTEFSYTREIAKKKMVFAASFQQSKESVNLGIAKERFSFGVSRELVKNTTIYTEFIHDEDYSISEGGTGKSSHSVAALFGYDF